MVKKAKKAQKKREKMSVCCATNMKMSGCGGAFYALGFIGALIYYWTTATSLWMSFVGFLKALVWPAVLVFELLVFLGA